MVFDEDSAQDEIADVLLFEQVSEFSSCQGLEATEMLLDRSAKCPVFSLFECGNASNGSCEDEPGTLKLSGEVESCRLPIPVSKIPFDVSCQRYMLVNLLDSAFHKAAIVGFCSSNRRVEDAVPLETQLDLTPECRSNALGPS